MYRPEKYSTPTKRYTGSQDYYLPPMKGSPSLNRSYKTDEDSVVRPQKRALLKKQDSTIYDKNTRCGVGSCKPDCFQSCANTTCYLIIYCYLGLVQGMYYTYFLAVISTIEKRFGISSKYTGILLSGNDIAQVVSSLFLAYYGGKGNRPRWIAGGMLCTSLALVLMAIPHFIYGAGTEALEASTSVVMNSTLGDISLQTQHSMCLAVTESSDRCEEGEDMWPAMIIIFVALALQGAGSTCYYSLGLPYLDDNSEPGELPAFLGINGGIRVLGPFFGFVLGYACLRFYISPVDVPDGMNEDDPRWLGAWWIGFIFVAVLLLLGSFIVLLFPNELPKAKKRRIKTMKRRLLSVDDEEEEIKPVGLRDMMRSIGRLLKNRLVIVSLFGATLTLFGYIGFYTFMAKYVELQFRISSSESSLYTGIANVLVQVVGYALAGIVIKYWKPSASKVAGWCVFIGLVEVVGFLGVMQIHCPDLNLHGFVQDNKMIDMVDSCNRNCNCTTEYYNPVCYVPSGTTFYSPCYAGCIEAIDEEDKATLLGGGLASRMKRSLGGEKKPDYIYYGCSCLQEPTNKIDSRILESFKTPEEIEKIKMSRSANIRGKDSTIHNSHSPIEEGSKSSYMDTKMEKRNTKEESGRKKEESYLDELINFFIDDKSLTWNKDSKASSGLTAKAMSESKLNHNDGLELENSSQRSTDIDGEALEHGGDSKSQGTTDNDNIKPSDNSQNPKEKTETATQPGGSVVTNKVNTDDMNVRKNDLPGGTRNISEEELHSIAGIGGPLDARPPYLFDIPEEEEQSEIEGYDQQVVAGFCDDGCDNYIWYFVGLGALKTLTSTSRVGGMLIILRAVATEDKSMLMGLFTFVVSAFAFIPCPIVYGAIIDTTCVIWKEKCGENANCAFYDMNDFRTYLHGTSGVILAIALVFDILIFFFAKKIHLYGDEEKPQENGTNVNELYT